MADDALSKLRWFLDAMDSPQPMFEGARADFVAWFNALPAANRLAFRNLVKGYWNAFVAAQRANFDAQVMA